MIYHMSGTDPRLVIKEMKMNCEICDKHKINITVNKN